MSPAWVAMIAALPRELVPVVAKRWMAAVAEECGDPAVESGPDVENALLALVDLCREAQRRQSSVVFASYL